ncbi:hypothetical protein TNIN_291491 [Trichonephila inaurata madagascariensis]|uniref:Uncharacterized protein n=1 Tax=Trichonephila inaurata madagascariensis TaxID=2747483 RepID=A0A8X6YIH4_9ARAC|nr:hypothetical protein TNIN_291491 [Trichonephila inaurata madagascariensis]
MLATRTSSRKKKNPKNSGSFILYSIGNGMNHRFVAIILGLLRLVDLWVQILGIPENVKKESKLYIPDGLLLSLHLSHDPRVNGEKVSSAANGRRVSGCPDFCSASLAARKLYIPDGLLLSLHLSHDPRVNGEKVSSAANGRRVSGCPDFCSASLAARAGVILPSHATGTRRRIFPHASGLVSCPVRKMLCD